MAALVREASVAALKEFISAKGSATMKPISELISPNVESQKSTGSITVARRHFDIAVAKISPSVSDKVIFSLSLSTDFHI